MIEAAVLRYFREVARAGSLTAASESLGVAPSAISRQVRMLEEHFGTRLFNREARGMSLSPAGVVLLEFLTKQSQEAEDFRTRFDDYLDIPRGRIRVATIEGVLPRLLVGFVRDFQQRHPHVKLSVEVVGSNTAADMVARQQADLGLLFGPSPRGDLIELAFMQQPLCLIVARNHPLAKKKACSVSDLSEHRVVVPDSTFGIRQEMERAAALAKVNLNVMLETNSIALMRKSAVDGGAATFLPRHAVFDEVQTGTVVAIPFKEKRLSKTRITLVRSAAQPLTTSAQKAVDIFRLQMAADS